MTNDGGGGRSSYSRSLEQPDYKNAYQKALSPEVKKNIKKGAYPDSQKERYQVGTYDAETQDFYHNGKKIVGPRVKDAVADARRVNSKLLGNALNSVGLNKASLQENLNNRGFDKTYQRIFSRNEKPSEFGNVNLNNRPVLQNDDGSISTVNSISFNDDGIEVLVPTIGYDADGKPYQMSEQEAIDHYYKTGEHLGKFNSVDEANRFAERLHRDQERRYR